MTLNRFYLELHLVVARWTFSLPLSFTFTIISSFCARSVLHESVEKNATPDPGLQSRDINTISLVIPLLNNRVLLAWFINNSDCRTTMERKKCSKNRIINNCSRLDRREWQTPVILWKHTEKESFYYPSYNNTEHKCTIVSHHFLDKSLQVTVH